MKLHVGSYQIINLIRNISDLQQAWQHTVLHHKWRVQPRYPSLKSLIYNKVNCLFGIPLTMDFYSVLVADMVIMLIQLAHHTNYTLNIGPLNNFFVDSHI